jgi:hypothetical protein
LAIEVSQGWIYVLGYEDEGELHDFTIKAISPEGVTATTPVGRYATCGPLQVEAGYMAIACSDATTTLYRLDNPATPVPYATIPTDYTATNCAAILLDPPYLYAPQQNLQQTHVYDVTQSGTPVPIHTIPAATPNSAISALIPWNGYLVRLDSSGAKVSDIVDISDPATATARFGTFAMSPFGCGNGIETRGDMLYATTPNGFEIWQLTSAFYQHLPLAFQGAEPDPALRNYVGLFGYTKAGANAELRTLRADNSDIQTLVTDWNVSGAWSPDGEQIALLQSTEDYSYLNVMNRDGSDQRQVGQFVRAEAWSPNSHHLLYTRSGQYDRDLWVFDTTNNTSQLVTTADEVDIAPQWSSDSQTLYFHDEVLVNNVVHKQVFASDADGSNRRQITEGDEDITLLALGSNDTQFIGGVKGEDGLQDLYRFDVEGSHSIPLVIAESEVRFISIAPDRQQFLYMLPNSAYDQGRLYRYTLETNTTTELSAPLCGERDCSIRHVEWSPSQEQIAIALAIYESYEIGWRYELWLLPLNPTLPMPTAPFALGITDPAWLGNDRYLTAIEISDDARTSTPVRFDLDRGTKSDIFPAQPNVRWVAAGWRWIPNSE